MRSRAEMIIQGGSRSGGLNSELQSRNSRMMAGFGGIEYGNASSFRSVLSVEGNAAESDDGNRFYSRSREVRLKDANMQFSGDPLSFSAGVQEEDPVPGGFLFSGTTAGISGSARETFRYGHGISGSVTAFCSRAEEKVFAGGRPAFCLNGIKTDYKYYDIYFSLFDYQTEFRTDHEKKIRFSGFQNRGTLLNFSWNITGIYSQGFIKKTRQDSIRSLAENAVISGTGFHDPLFTEAALKIIQKHKIHLRSGAFFINFKTGWGHGFFSKDAECTSFQKQQGICSRSDPLYPHEAEFSAAFLRGDRNPQDQEYNGFASVQQRITYFGGRASVLFTHPPAGSLSHAFYADDGSPDILSEELNHKGVRIVSFRYGYTSLLSLISADILFTFADFTDAKGAEMIFFLSGRPFRKYNIRLFASVTGAALKIQRKRETGTEYNLKILTEENSDARLYRSFSAGIQAAF